MYQGIAGDVAAVMEEAKATGLLVSLCTVQRPDGAVTTDGAASGNFVDVAGLVDIPCIDAVLSPSNIQASEAKQLTEILSKSYQHVALNGYYPQLFTTGSGAGGAPQGWRVIVDGVVYDLLGAETDSQATQTRLKLQLATL